MKGSKGRSKPLELGVPVVLVFCCISFLFGFFGSVLFSRDLPGGGGPHLQRMEAAVELPVVLHGESGESKPFSIPFQVLSWKPRSVYFPRFATDEQCQSMIEMSKSRLTPSTLALREGETVENTKGVRTRHSISSAMRLGKVMPLITMHSVQPNMAHNTVKG